MPDPDPPSGPWSGYYTYSWSPSRHYMALRLDFRGGALSGLGDDDVGPFTISGRFDLEAMEIHWTKRYLGRHDVFYKGFLEPARIWGTWELPGRRGGFMIWPGDGNRAWETSTSRETELPSEEDVPAVAAPSPSRRA